MRVPVRFTVRRFGASASAGRQASPHGFHASERCSNCANAPRPARACTPQSVTPLPARLRRRIAEKSQPRMPASPSTFTATSSASRRSSIGSCDRRFPRKLSSRSRGKSPASQPGGSSLKARFRRTSVADGAGTYPPHSPRSSDSNSGSRTPESSAFPATDSRRNFGKCSSHTRKAFRASESSSRSANAGARSIARLASSSAFAARFKCVKCAYGDSASRFNPSAPMRLPRKSRCVTKAKCAAFASSSRNGAMATSRTSRSFQRAPCTRNARPATASPGGGAGSSSHGDCRTSCTRGARCEGLAAMRCNAFAPNRAGVRARNGFANGACGIYRSRQVRRVAHPSPPASAPSTGFTP